MGYCRSVDGGQEERQGGSQRAKNSSRGVKEQEKGEGKRGSRIADLDSKNQREEDLLMSWEEGDP